MKKISCAVVCNLFMLSVILSCNRNNISLTVNDSDHYYKISAHYNKTRPSAIDRILNRHFERNNNISFTNTQIDADMTLDDGTKFYMKKSPGHLFIRFNKDENSRASFNEIKRLSEELKPAIQ